jgi:hypothetical protein
MRRMCREYKKRPALFYDKRWKRVRADNDHDLCWRCYRAQLNRHRYKPAPRPEMVLAKVEDKSLEVSSLSTCTFSSLSSGIMLTEAAHETQVGGGRQDCP